MSVHEVVAEVVVAVLRDLLLVKLLLCFMLMFLAVNSLGVVSIGVWRVVVFVGFEHLLCVFWVGKRETRTCCDNPLSVGWDSACW